MEDNVQDLRDLQTTMELQVQGMQDFQLAQLAVRDALRVKDWPRLDKRLRDLDFQSEGLRCLEERRHALWTSVQARYLGRRGRFSETVRLLPEAFREPLTKLHHDLKIETLALRSLTQALNTYVRAAGDLIQAVVHELQPATKGRIYSRNGYLRGGEPQPLVLNTHF